MSHNFCYDAHQLAFHDSEQGVPLFSGDLHQKLCEVATKRIQTKDGMRQRVTFVDRNSVRHAVARVHHHARRAGDTNSNEGWCEALRNPRKWELCAAQSRKSPSRGPSCASSKQRQNSTDRHVNGEHVERREHDLLEGTEGKGQVLKSSPSSFALVETPPKKYRWCQRSELGHARCASRSTQRESVLVRHVHGGHVEGLEHDLCHALLDRIRRTFPSRSQPAGRY